MSRGNGWLESAILEEIEELARRAAMTPNLPHEPFCRTAAALAYVYQRGKPYIWGWEATPAQRKATFRAMRSLAHKYPDRFRLEGGQGRTPLLLCER